jgi:hypothetical protein
MAKKQLLSTKRLAIDKANATLMISLGIAAFIVVFSLVASKSLLDQRSYQSKVISKKKIARTQLDADLKAVDTLNISYQAFAQSSPNVIGGDPNGSGDRDGENARIVLDALPSKYDFPALATSIDKLLKSNQYVLTNIVGTDDEVVQSAAQSSGTPAPVEMPFSVDVTTTSSSVKSLMNLFEHSIRPMQVQKMNITGQSDQLKVTINAKTFFQPEKKLDIKDEVVK